MAHAKFTIAICPNAFKGTLSAADAAACIERGLRAAIPGVRLVEIPFADGGDGTMQAVVDATRGKLFRNRVHDPLSRSIRAAWGITGDGETAIIELAAASGLAMLKSAERRPLATSSFGTGELIKAAMDRGCKKILVGIGGSATTDGGTGIAGALGVRFLDHRGRDIPQGGGGLAALHRIDTSALDPRVKATAIDVACDVQNPLLGRNGAAHVYGPQKGASPAQVRALDQNLRRLTRIVERDLNVQVANIPGAGAAGGAGAGLIAFLGASLRPGAALVAEALHLPERLAGCDLVITGEGRLDAQTAHGKAPTEIARIARRLKIPAIAICGSVSAEAARPGFLGFHAVFSALADPADPRPIEETAAESLERAAWHAGRILALAGRGRFTQR